MKLLPLNQNHIRSALIVVISLTLGGTIFYFRPKTTAHRDPSPEKSKIERHPHPVVGGMPDFSNVKEFDLTQNAKTPVAAPDLKTIHRTATVKDAQEWAAKNPGQWVLPTNGRPIRITKMRFTPDKNLHEDRLAIPDGLTPPSSPIDGKGIHQ